MRKFRKNFNFRRSQKWLHNFQTWISHENTNRIIKKKKKKKK